jgi:hypothetical protein
MVWQVANRFSDTLRRRMKASYLFKSNIEALLRARGHTKHDLAQWCRRTDAWLSKIMGKDDRNLPMKYLDRIADFFGLSAYQLFQPGITPYLDRRQRQRRSGTDRRLSVAMAAAVGQQVDPADLATVKRFNALSVDDRRRVESWMAALESRRAPGGVTVHPPAVAASAATPATPPRRTRAPRHVPGH